MMKKFVSLLAGAALFAACMTGCSGSSTDSSPQESIEKTTATTESMESINDTSGATVDYSSNFSIEYLEDGIKKVIDGDGRELILVPKSLGEIPEKYADSTVITTPVQNAIYMSSTQICMLRAADNGDIWDSVGAVSSDASSFSGLNDLISRMDNGEILNVGGMMNDPDYEQIQMLNPDVVFVYTGDYGQQNIISKLDELGINYAVDNEFLETDYLARMEWMKFILSFYDAEDEANTYMTNAEQTFSDIKTKLKGTESKKVAIFNVYDGAAYGISGTGWSGNLLSDVGGTNAFAGIDSESYTMEALFDCVQDADVIIYTSAPSICSDMSAIEDAFPQITECAAYKNDNIYQINDSYWTSIDQTDILAEDLASIIHPDIFPDRSLTYYAKIEK